MNPLYIIERYEHGWLVKSGGVRGIPMDLFTEVCGICKDSAAIIAPGVASALDGMFAFGNKSEIAKWEQEIDAAVDANPLIERKAKWLHKTDTGISALTIYAALIDSPSLAERARRYYGHLMPGDIPRDADDFGRCQRLLNLFPGWEDRIGEVATAYPTTYWPKLVPLWAEAKALWEDGNSRALSQLLSNIK